MKKYIALSLIFFSLTLFATEQSSDILIYKSDTIFIDIYPLEKLMDSDSTIHERIYNYDEDFYMSSGCWRGHIGTWIIENDSLFLINLLNGCGEDQLKLDKIFGSKKVKDGKVFASWFKGRLNADFGRYLMFDIPNWKGVYTKSLSCKIINGQVNILQIIEKNDCEIASIMAQKDFEENKYSVHSIEFFPVENTYTHVLNKYYQIEWFFTDSIDYYNCYDSVMILNLEMKYGEHFLDEAKHITDSLELTKNWISNAEFIGGQTALIQFILSRLTFEPNDMNELKTKLFIKLEIDSIGTAVNPIIIKGISKEIDKKVIDIIHEMPKWKPAYLYGQPIKQIYHIPMRLDYQ